MFTKILIANRGEIACRIIRTAHRLGIKCIAIYSEADANALHVRLADEAYCVGPAPSQQSYLCDYKIIQIALATGAQAIHPGYGFLAENAEFAAMCQQANLTFIGPSPSAIRAMGSKIAAKRLMEKAKVPLIPGYHGEQQDITTLQAAAAKLGYPILLKAAAGGGGKGMRIVQKPEEFATALAAVKREALTSFVDDQLLIEKYFTNPRHVEIQVFADNTGNTVYLFERDCSIQRRYQKIIEEAPAPHMTEKLREAMGNAAVAAAKAIQYTGAGTIEFLLADNQFYFMEMNTRLQVEHPVTEMITKVDLVEWQLRIAAGEVLPLSQKQLKIYGHAFEARIYAEDPYKNFLPSIGKIEYLKTPAASATVRLDSGISQDDTITAYYDPMLAKLIVWGIDRNNALQQLTNALTEFQLVGVHNNLNLLTAISQHPAFSAGKVHTGFINNYQAELLQPLEISTSVQIIATLFIILTQQNNINNLNSAACGRPNPLGFSKGSNGNAPLGSQARVSRAQRNQISKNSAACGRVFYKSFTDVHSPWNNYDSWRLNLPAQQQIEFEYAKQKLISIVKNSGDAYSIAINNKSFTVIGTLTKAEELQVVIDSNNYKADIFYQNSLLNILINGKRYELIYLHADNNSLHSSRYESKVNLTAPMPGKIVSLNAKVGEHVKQGTALVIIEAMKMEHTIYAPYTGIVKEWYFAVGDLVNEGIRLLEFEEVKQ